MQKIVYAKFNNCLQSQQKVRLVANLIRGKSAAEAKDILTYTNKAAARELLKTLNAAIANSVHNNNFDKKQLQVAEVMVDEATTYKRGRATARGRYHQILKRNCHIKIGLKNGKIDDPSEVENKKVEKVVESKKTQVKTKSAKVVKKTTKKVAKNLSKKEVKK
jgi:large subunit ribosomal protein L22